MTNFDTIMATLKNLSIAELGQIEEEANILRGMARKDKNREFLNKVQDLFNEYIGEHDCSLLLYDLNNGFQFEITRHNLKTIDINPVWDD